LKKKSKKKTDFEHFYRGIRAQVEQVEEKGDNCEIEDIENDDEIFEDNVSILNAIVRINDKITKHERKKLSYYIKLGDLLMNLKLRYIKRCYKCAEDPSLDSSTCCSCKKMNSNNINDFFRDVKTVMPFVKSYVNFFITVR
jgi:hypothetical protein